jgi:hypothetical protein
MLNLFRIASMRVDDFIGNLSGLRTIDPTLDECYFLSYALIRYPFFFARRCWERTSPLALRGDRRVERVRLDGQDQPVDAPQAVFKEVGVLWSAAIRQNGRLDR